MKDEIRQQILKIRKNISSSEVKEKSKIIGNRLLSLKEFIEAKTVLFYVSYDNEVFTHDIIKKILKDKEIIVPKSDKKNRSLILSKLDSWDDLTIGAYNILELKNDKIIPVLVDEIDLIIVPGVVFDENGHRIGHGMGYYDRLLNNSKKATSIGLAFEFQIVDSIPVEKHDLPVDIIVTEKRIINCLN